MWDMLEYLQRGRIGRPHDRRETEVDRLTASELNVIESVVSKGFLKMKKATFNDINEVYANPVAKGKCDNRAAFIFAKVLIRSIEEAPYKDNGFKDAQMGIDFYESFDN